MTGPLSLESKRPAGRITRRKSLFKCIVYLFFSRMFFAVSDSIRVFWFTHRYYNQSSHSISSNPHYSDIFSFHVNDRRLSVSSCCSALETLSVGWSLAICRS